MNPRLRKAIACEWLLFVATLALTVLGSLGFYAYQVRRFPVRLERAAREESLARENLAEARAKLDAFYQSHPWKGQDGKDLPLWAQRLLGVSEAEVSPLGQSLQEVEDSASKELDRAHWEAGTVEAAAPRLDGARVRLTLGLGLALYVLRVLLLSLIWSIRALRTPTA